MDVNKILSKPNLNKKDIEILLKLKGQDCIELYEKSAEIKKKHVGNKVYLRGLIELSNICEKNCYYCGIRADNQNVVRYNISDREVLEAARYAFVNNFGSIAIQSGEIKTKSFTRRIEDLCKQIKKMSDNKLGITLSCGEQKPDVYKKWFDAGAHRYLLRIETSNHELYKIIHPNDSNHLWDKRIQCLYHLKNIGFQTGTGIMIGLPFQSIRNLAEDIFFMKDNDIDMCGMGPYIEHNNTPLYAYKNALLNKAQRFELSMKMTAILRLVMKDINIVSSTAIQAIKSNGREKILEVGANVIMPNITPQKFRSNYLLYENKPGTNSNNEDSKNNVENIIKKAGCKTGYGDWGDSKHYMQKNASGYFTKNHLDHI